MNLLEIPCIVSFQIATKNMHIAYPCLQGRPQTTETTQHEPIQYPRRHCWAASFDVHLPKAGVGLFKMNPFFHSVCFMDTVDVEVLQDGRAELRNEVKIEYVPTDPSGGHTHVFSFISLLWKPWRYGVNSLRRWVKGRPVAFSVAMHIQTGTIRAWPEFCTRCMMIIIICCGTLYLLQRFFFVIWFWGELPVDILGGSVIYRVVSESVNTNGGGSVWYVCTWVLHLRINTQ